MTPQPLPSKLQTPQVAVGPCDLGPLELRWFLHLSRRASHSSSRLYYPELAYPRLADSTQQGWETAGHRGGIPFSMGSKPTELTKPLLPHPSSGSCEHTPTLKSLPVLHWGQQSFLPSSPSCHFPSLERLTLDNLGATEPWPASWLEP